MKKDFIDSYSKIEAPQDGSQYVFICEQLVARPDVSPCGSIGCGE